MSSSVEYFLKKTLGEDFLESLAKVELWKPGTKSTLDHEEIRTALQIVPRTIMAMLIRELAPMSIGQNKRVPIFVVGNAFLNVTKHERDVFSGDLEQAGKKIVDFKFRSIPGVGLVILTAFELYDMENLINTPITHEPLVSPVPAPSEDVERKVQKLIDDRLALYDLIGKVVDKKIMEKEAIHELFLKKLSQLTQMAKETAPISDNYFRGMANGIEVVNSVANNKEPEFVNAPKKNKKFPVQDFLDSRKNKIKKNEYSIHLAKNEMVHCPDCGGDVFDGTKVSGCLCLGEDREKRVFIKKSEEGIKVRFSKGWDQENIEMLLDILRRKNG